MWNRLQTLMAEHPGKFSVYFMNKTEPDRKWTIDDEIKFTHAFWDMKIYYLFGIPLRFSLSYCLSAIEKSDHLILGSSWNDLNVLFIVILKRMKLIKNRISFWTEANKLTLGASKKSRIKYFLRRWILNTSDGYYIIPGKMSEITLTEWGISIKGKYLMLPNVTHAAYDEYFGKWSGSGNSRPVLIIVARLQEKLKGIINFLSSIGLKNIKKVTIKIIGSGPDEDLYKDYIKKNNLFDNINILGELKINQVIENLISADCFVLPSFSDPSPLSLVEATKIGLPLLISRRCGNHFECLVEGENGFSFDPYDPQSIRTAFEKFLENKARWSSFSQASLSLARRFHATDTNLVELLKILR